MDPQRDTRRRLWRAQALEPGLYPVATPIGNLRDITLRALDILANCDLVLAEDTRKTRVLFDAYGLTTPLTPYHDHNGEAVRPGILDRLADGAAIALVSDAGTPLIADPGYKLVREAVAAGHRVSPAPGASAVLAGLSAAGLPTDRFVFAGFPSSKAGQRARLFASLAQVEATLVFYESPRRVGDSLAAMSDAFGAREAVVAREMTKTFEEIRRAPLADLAAHYGEGNAPKGEVVIVVGPPGERSRWDVDAVDAAVLEALSTTGVKAVAAAVSAVSGWSKNDVYARAVALKNARQDKP